MIQFGVYLRNMNVCKELCVYLVEGGTRFEGGRVVFLRPRETAKGCKRATLGATVIRVFWAMENTTKTLTQCS